jgi:hypothetical protein
VYHHSVEPLREMSKRRMSALGLLPTCLAQDGMSSSLLKADIGAEDQHRLHLRLWVKS